MCNLKKIAGFTVLPVMATRAEYGPALQAMIDPLICGVGPVEAAITLSARLATTPNSNQRPDLVISLGSAGSATLEQAAVYQVSHVSYRDMDASAFGFPKGETPFLGLPAEIPLAPSVEGLRPARLSTGANVVSGDAYRTIDADMVDMETWSIARACHASNIPLIGLRGISDGAEPVSGYADWTQYLHIVDERLADALNGVEQALADGRIDLMAWRPPQNEV
ncbi:5'-methylthioadenosine/S-adenosylhomocysteine nucleosidase [Pseudahrensia aquimaris]|uniref:5'-methylthioadenosine/S-adenosylhomocysteine nucleosidase n=1 Tax=Pseudahrensia aquimaris TaxID=744461 RepID=A0ABW3FE99_9HYPH